MGIAGIITFIALAAAPPTDVHTEPPSGGSSSSFIRCGLEQVEPPAFKEGSKQFEWLGPEFGGAFADASLQSNPNSYGVAQSFTSLGSQFSLVYIGGFGYQPGGFGLAVGEAHTDLTTFDTIVFARAGFPPGTPFLASVTLDVYGGLSRGFGDDSRDDGHVTLRWSFNSSMIPEPAMIELSSRSPDPPSLPARFSHFVTLRTGVEYRLNRAQHVSVSPVRVGIKQIAFCSGTIGSRITIRPFAPGVTCSSRASVLYTTCPSDLDSSWFVDDADFLLFAAAHALGDCSDPTMPLGCPADLNYDGIVDAADFVLFLPAYDEGYCPLFGDIDFGPQ